MRNVAVLAVCCLCLASCSPWYVLRAGWEEAGILFRRKKIEKIIASSDIDPAQKQKLRLVLDARTYTESIGLIPKGSFTQYSSIPRDVLVWVLSAAPKTALVSYTWWFPIVGRVPYKGFFEKEDALEEANKLKKRGYDFYVRPSAAFSTLGWFNDPLLSTMLKFDDVSLANTVLHEILHNTVWIPNHASFNETLANVVGALGSQEFFTKKKHVDAALAKLAKDRWHDEQIYAAYLDKSATALRDFYAAVKRKNSGDADETSLNKSVEEEVIEQREKLFQTLVQNWAQHTPELRTKAFVEAGQKLNNAVVIAQLIYLDRPWLFMDLFQTCGCSLERFISEIKQLQKKYQDDKTADPFNLLAEQTAELKQKTGNSAVSECSASIYFE